MSRLSLRLRLIVAATTAVAIAVILAAGGAYLTTRHELRHQVDAALQRRLATAGRFIARPDFALGLPRGRELRPLADAATFQAVTATGEILARNGSALPVNASDLRLAADQTGVRLRDVTVDGVHLRMATRGTGNGVALQVAQPLDAVDATLHHLVLLLTLLALGGVAVAVGLGTLVARAALAPVDRLTAAAERVAATRDLSATIEVHGADEVARLASALNAMLVAVDESQRAERRLVADASHELRTPLTSLRTNLEVLARSPILPEGERQSLLNDLIAQVSELSSLVGQLVDLDRDEGTGPGSTEAPAPVALDEVVEAAVARARLNHPSVVFTAVLEPTVVNGLSGVLGRAVANLLDNAGKWSPPGGTVEVKLAEGVVRVTDHGPGIDAGDAPHVFERFYRAAAARGLPGSGLGLSIVQQAAEDHGGRAWVEPASGGGTVACLAVPVEEPAQSGSFAGVEPPSPRNRARADTTSPSASDASRQPPTVARLPGSSDL
jgi:two-component system sensor histidine kinase MprB